jgi:predicted RNA-binding Zn ribbon-like protein
MQQLRDAIRQVLIARDDGDAAGDVARPLVIEMPVTVQFAEGGLLSVTPSAEGAADLRGRALLAIRDAQLTGAWQRLKVCRSAECRVAFWDNSRNMSAHWHDVRTCGNVTNLRSSRARRRQAD